MHRQSDSLTFSPTDLTVFLESDFASWMDRWEAERRALERSGDTAALAAWLAQLTFAADAVPDADEGRAVVAEAGTEHEKKFLSLLKGDGKQVLEISTESSADAARQTLDAMRGGAEIIYQARLEAAPFAGWADFLVRGPGDSRLGSWHYEAWDTKLARSTRAKFVVQLCAYSEMLESAQGRLPDAFEVVLGTGEHSRFVTAGCFFYYLDFKEAFLKFQGDFSPGRMPPPGLAAGFGGWGSCARKLLEATDHLSVVARITRTQVKKLEAAGIHTLAGLSGDERLHVPKLADDKLVELRAQARLQMASRGREKPLHEVIRPAEDDPRKGLALLPASSPGDVFFDMEGYPLVDGGLEYLFGATTLLAGDAVYSFNDWWAHDSSQEKMAFEAFVDWAFERWRRDSSAHIYHYAAYEVSALKRLMGYHATREEKVDDLLRNHVFVDIYTVVRQGLRLGTRSYSLKDVERMYRPKRAGGVTTAAGSMVAYHRWLESGEPQAWEDSPILREIRDYNRVDCESLAELCGWLREVQDDSAISFVPPPTPRAEGENGGGESAVGEPPARILAARLLQEVEAGLPAEPERRGVQQLVAWLLEYHWREAKPVFWRKFSRHEMTETELVEELDCLGALQRTDTPPRLIKKSNGHEFRFDPDQDTKLDEGDKCFYSHDLAIQVEISGMDREKGLVEIKLGPKKPAPPGRLSLIPDEYVRADVIAAAVLRFAAAWHAGDGASDAVDDLLHRRLPRLRGQEGGPVLARDADLVTGTVDAIRRLDGSTLAIQGPPGSGKTFTAAAAIAALMSDGRRVAVTATGHKTIVNLMMAVVEQLRQMGLAGVRLVKVGGAEENLRGAEGKILYLKDSSLAAEELGNRPLLMGGTSWLFSREELQGRFDYLFVDEASQFPLANVVATGPCARNIVLLGDQMQLAQPVQGTHPGESGLSALEYLLHGHATIPPERGVFLDVTRRMHPDVCRFVSDAVYEGRLRSHPDTERYCVSPGVRWRGSDERATGIIHVAVDHEGNSQSSPEEVDAIAAMTESLLAGSVQEKDGSLRPMTWEDILLVAPYNMQVRRLRERLGAQARVGSVDRFQGLEAHVVVVSMCASSVEDVPRGLGFLLSPNRLNVAVSRARALAIVVGSRALGFARCQSVEDLQLVNLYARLTAFARKAPQKAMLRPLPSDPCASEGP